GLAEARPHGRAGDTRAALAAAVGHPVGVRRRQFVPRRLPRIPAALRAARRRARPAPGPHARDERLDRGGGATLRDGVLPCTAPCATRGVDPVLADRARRPPDSPPAAALARRD